ncbi:MAG: hypothetical protein IKK34_14520 [Clostridia bacterium]|nr:hypothetical protein [Clostridia bacterium]
MKNVPEIKKLAELDGDEMATLLCRIAEPAANIFADPKTAEFFAAGVELRKTSPSMMVYMTQLAALGAPVLLGEKHREDIFEILAALKGRTKQEIRKQKGMQTMQEIIHILMSDADLMTFFRLGAAHEAPGDQVSDLQIRPAADGASAG